MEAIVNKVWESSQISFSDLVSSSGLYRFSNVVFSENPNLAQLTGSGTGKKITSKIMSKAKNIFKKVANGEADIEMIGLISNKRTKRYVNSKYIQNNMFLDKYKVMIPKANGSGKLGETISTPFVAKPFVGGTDTFLSLGPVSTNSEAENILKYIKTKFCRTLLGVKKITQDNPKSVWQYVPQQNFDSDSDIDWSKTIPEIDQQLYKKYDLSEDEIKFIESKVQDMK